MEAAVEDTPLEEVSPVEPLRVTAFEVLHADRDSRLVRGDEQVEVIGHQAVRVELPLVADERQVEQREKPLPIPVVREERQLAHPAADEVVDASFDLNPGLTRQTAGLSGQVFGSDPKTWL